MALYDRRRQRPSRRTAPALEVQRILRLYRERFAGWNVRHFYRFLFASNREIFFLEQLAASVRRQFLIL